ncbi:MAG: YitT family protein [Clostridia bacterium]|nr:YitT family protein [Clostridia bacterium]MBP5194107.1 YitT family protein [Clostridia bacterium]
MKKAGKIIGRVLLVILGTVAYSIGMTFFVNPHDLAPGGFTGVAVILNRAIKALSASGFELDLGIIVFALNVPLLIVGLIKLGKEFLVGTVFGTILLSLFTYLFGDEMLRGFLLGRGQTWFIVESPIVASIFGGIMMGVGLGLVFHAGATTGGTDIIVKLLRQKYRYARTGRIFFITDTIICISSLPVVGWKVETVLYAIMSMFVCNYVLDLVLYGTDGAKQVYVISNSSKTIAERILKELDIGATYLEGTGAFSGEKKEVLLCVVKKQLYPKLKDIVKQEDPRAFLIVGSANEVFGEGYKDHFKEEL